MAAPQPSARLVRAVAAERAELERHRARLTAEAGELRSALARIEHGLAEIDERCGLLERLAPAAPPAESEPADTTRSVLRGPAIREAAVKALTASGRDQLHYREWFELLTGDNRHVVAGKDPLAVFLTQLSRSPAVRKGPGAGVYELDIQAAPRLRDQIDGLQRELRELSATGAADLAAIRARRTQLSAEISRAERALEEVTRVLSPAPELAAVGQWGVR
jgi:septal ring factor EnvC (AmiA/AmiB activator)